MERAPEGLAMATAARNNLTGTAHLLLSVAVAIGFIAVAVPCRADDSSGLDDRGSIASDLELTTADRLAARAAATSPFLDVGTTRFVRFAFSRTMVRMTMTLTRYVGARMAIFRWRRRGGTIVSLVRWRIVSERMSGHFEWANSKPPE